MPIYVPKDDPYLKDTGIRCMNLTRALSFEEVQCVSNDVPFSVVNFATPLLDLQPIYGPNLTVADSVRTGVDGLLAMEYRNKRYVPPGKSAICFANKPGEPCYEVGDTGINFQPKLALVEIWFLRLHNAIASKLSLINSCWDDEHLYRTARQITIAIHQKISFYELLPGFLGYENMFKRGLISKDDGYVNSYDSCLDTRTSAEVAVAYRVLHSLLDDSFGLYDKDAKLVGVTALNLYLFGAGVLENNDNMESMSRSMFYQPAADSRRHADTAMSNNMYRAFHKANDLFTIDIMRGRDFGLRSYNKYRKYCGLPKAHRFEDLKDTMDSEAILKLRKLYHSVDAIELVPGLIAERELPDTAVGPVLLCILGEQFGRLKNADRFWFENGKVKTRLSQDQLAAVKEYTMSRLVCDHADGVFKVQPNPFLVVSKENPLMKCDSYTQLDLTLWRDSFCDMAPNGRIN